MDSRVLVFSRNLIYNLGGAERSIFARVQTQSYSNIDLVYATQPNQESRELTFVNEPVYSHFPINGVKLQSRFFYVEYFRNKSLIESAVQSLDFDELMAQNRWAPAAILAAENMGRESTLFLRDETSLGIIRNYYEGGKKVQKNIYTALESPWIAAYKKDVKLALHAATSVVANSCFMANRLFELYRVESTVEYPRVDTEQLKKEYAKEVAGHRSPHGAVVMVGDNRIKGIDIFIDLAKRFSKQEFFVFGKGNLKNTPPNLVHKGWASSAATVYANAKVVVVPSLWEEAFGRVAVEARSLGIPVIVSNRGGLPEAVNHDPSCIASGADDFAAKLGGML